MKAKVLVSTARSCALNVVAIESGVEVKSGNEWVLFRAVWKEGERRKNGERKK